MPSFLETVRRTSDKYGMLAPGRRAVAAVSGGPDSVAMLHALRELSGELDISLAVAHLDHGFRPESADEAGFVRGMAEDMGLPFFTEQARLKERLLERPENRQEAARRVRYEFLEKVRQEFNADKISVGHTADDQAETLLMRLLRGSGTRGLSAIPPVRGRIIRPLIEATRADVLEYLAERGVPYVTDPSNLKPDYLRNRLRMELLPSLRKYNPEAIKSLCKSADILREEGDFLDRYAGRMLEDISRETRGGALTLGREALLGLHPAIRRRVMRLAVGRVKGDLLGVGFTHLAEAEELVSSGLTGKSLDLPGGVRVWASYGDVCVGKIREKIWYETELPAPGRVELPQAGMAVEATAESPHPRVPSPGGRGENNEACFDMGLVKGPLVIRNRRPGDAFYPVGMEGRKKLQDFFVDKKVPRELRDAVPVLTCGDEIMWVIGMRRDRRFLAGPETKETVLIKALPLARYRERGQGGEG